MPVYWVDTIASPAKSIVSQIRPRNRLYDATSHEAWTSGYARDVHWIYFFLTRIRENCHVGNVDILGLDIESSGLNSAILRFSDIQWYSSSYFRILIFEHLHRFSAAYCMIFMTDVLNTQVCATRAVCILVPGWSLQWYVIIQETDFCFPESYLYKTIKPSVQLEPLTVYCFLVSKRGCCVALRRIARLFQVALVLSNAMGLLHLDIHIFLESRLVTLNIWSPEPFGCVIQWFALHFMQLSHETKDFWTLSVSGFMWLWADDLFPGVDCVAPCALCHACAHSESTMAFSAMSYSMSGGWEHSRPSGESQCMIDHYLSGFFNERSRTSSVLLRWGRAQHGL